MKLNQTVSHNFDFIVNPTILSSEDGDNILLQNTGIYL